MQILAFCGSLRETSYNLSLLKEFKRRIGAPSMQIFEGLGTLPPFNPDDTVTHPTVQNLRNQIKAADALIIASPEYVHGVPGVLKNALDWIIGSAEWDGKPSVLLHVTPSAMEPNFVRVGLAEIINVMSGGCLIQRAGFVVTGAFKKFDRTGTIIDAGLSMQIDSAIAEIKAFLQARK